MKNPFKKTKAEQLDISLKKLIDSAKEVQEIMSTVTGENKHTHNLNLCLEDTIVIVEHVRTRLKKPVKTIKLKKEEKDENFE